MPSLGARPTVAIVDFDLGNLYSVRRACEISGLEAKITSSAVDIMEAQGVILPGVGSFRAAMETLAKNRCADAIISSIDRETPFMGICLGMQLLFEESHELGRTQGLGIVKGEVVGFEKGHPGFKVPHMGWNRIQRCEEGSPWASTPLQSLEDGAYMYFVHSFYCVPKEIHDTLTTTDYAGVRFCSSLRRGNVLACQFHPERSGESGLRIYRAFAEEIKRQI